MARWGIISQDRHLARSGSRHRRMEAPRLRSWPDCYGYTYSRDTRTWRCVKNLVTSRGWNGETCIHPSWTCGTGAEAVHRLNNLDIDDVMGDTWTAWRAWTTWNARSKAEGRQQTGWGLCMPGCPEYAYRANGQVVLHVFRVLGDNGRATAGRYSPERWSALGNPLAATGPGNGSAPARRPIRPWRPPPFPPKVPGLCFGATREVPMERKREHLSASSLFSIFQFPVSISLLFHPLPIPRLLRS